MTYNEVKELIGIVDNSTLKSFELTIDNVCVKMSKNNMDIVSQSPVNISHEPNNIVYTENKEHIEKEAYPSNDTSGNIVKAPIVGTFYASPGIGKPDFVKVGSIVKEGDTLCILEAMKIMNEVVSPYDGEIVEIYVSDGDMVEYGKPLFRIK